MSFPRYALMYYDTSNINNTWSLLNRYFILEENENDIVRGTFLSDLWFNYKIQEDSDIYFMILFIENKEKYKSIIDLLKTNQIINENHLPNVNNIPINTKFAKSFILTKEKLKNSRDKMEEKKQNSHIITLYQDNCTFNIEMMKHDSCYTVGLPKFEIN